MTLSHEPGHDDQLVRYLLGILPDEDAERLDELTVWDDEMAWRLRIVENDLVDAYVAGTLTGETLERFESFYMSSDRRRRKVRFARGFLAALERGAGTAAIDGGSNSIRGEAPSSQPSRVPSRRATWPLAAAAALFLLACGALYDGAGPPR
jgi:anti-sigma factor RsiW